MPNNTITPKNTQQPLHSHFIDSNKIVSSKEKLSGAEIIYDMENTVADIRKDNGEILQKLDQMLLILKGKIDQDKSENNNSPQNALA